MESVYVKLIGDGRGKFHINHQGAICSHGSDMFGSVSKQKIKVNVLFHPEDNEFPVFTKEDVITETVIYRECVCGSCISNFTRWMNRVDH